MFLSFLFPLLQYSAIQQVFDMTFCDIISICLYLFASLPHSHPCLTPRLLSMHYLERIISYSHVCCMTMIQINLVSLLFTLIFRKIYIIFFQFTQSNMPFRNPHNIQKLYYYIPNFFHTAPSYSNCIPCIMFLTKASTGLCQEFTLANKDYYY